MNFGEVQRAQKLRDDQVKAEERVKDGLPPIDDGSHRLPAGFKRFVPSDSQYELLQAGIELQEAPHTLIARGELTYEHLYHFRHRDSKVARCAPVEKLSKYVCAFHIAYMPDNVYILPIHDHLDEITWHLDDERAEEILPSGVPYMPDKRLARIRSDHPSVRRKKRKKLAGAKGPHDTVEKKKKKKKEKPPTPSSSSSSAMSSSAMFVKKAPIRIDGCVSNKASSSTIKSRKNGGEWNSGQVDTNAQQSNNKIKTMLSTLSEELGRMGSCVPLTDAEIAQMAAEAPAMKKKRRGPAPRVKSKAEVGRMRRSKAKGFKEEPGDEDIEALETKLKEQDDAEMDVKQYDVTVPVEEEQEQRKKTKKRPKLQFPVSSSSSSSGSSEVSDSSVASEDMTYEQWQRGREPKKRSSLVGKRDRKRKEPPMITPPPQPEATPKKKQKGKKKKGKSPPPPSRDAISKANAFIDRCLEDPTNQPRIPEEWRGVLAMENLPAVAKRACLMNTEYYQILLQMLENMYPTNLDK